MADLTVQAPGLTGAVPTFNTAAAGGDTFTNNGHTLIEVVNAHGSATRDVTIDARPTSVDKDGFGNIAISDTVVTIAASSRKVIGPFPPARFNNTSEKVSLSYSDSAANITVAVISTQA